MLATCQPAHRLDLRTYRLPRHNFVRRSYNKTRSLATYCYDGMDPLSITATVVALTATCMQTAKTLYQLRGRYSRSHLTLTAICSEITVISVCLSRLQAVMLESPDILSGSTNMRTDVRQAFETVLTGCMVVFSALDEEVQSLTLGVADSPKMTIFFARTKAAWKEGEMQDLLGQIRNQQVALNMLINLLQMESAAEIRRKIDLNAAMLADIARETRRIRSTRPSLRTSGSIYEAQFDTQQVVAFDSVSSIGTAMFEFDDAVVNSTAYRRVLRAAQSAQQRKQMSDGSIRAQDGDDGDDGGSEYSVRTARPGQAVAVAVTESVEYYLEIISRLVAWIIEREAEYGEFLDLRETYDILKRRYDILEEEYDKVKMYFSAREDQVRELEDKIKSLERPDKLDIPDKQAQPATQVATSEFSFIRKMVESPPTLAPDTRQLTLLEKALNEEWEAKKP